MALRNGKYAPVTACTVTTWPSPDANGDGPELYDPENNVDFLKDKNGDIVHAYLPPEGFSRIDGSDNKPTYVRLTDRRQIVRDADGAAVSIEEGMTLVEFPDGTTLRITNDRDRQTFERSYTFVQE